MQIKSAEVRVGSTTLEKIEVRNSLRQGYVSAAVANWQMKEAGVTVLYKHYRKLVDDHTTNARLSEENATKTQFTNTIALYTTSRLALKTITVSFVEVASEVGLTVQRN